MGTQYISLIGVRGTLTKLDGRYWSFRIALSTSEPSRLQWHASRSWREYVADLG
ncbi:MAG TPA: hypothetical protein PLQ71_12460 [Nitrospira sp.]|jgi:hypothetical protein|nr:hypothetical protein [Nitrospira sp.]